MLETLETIAIGAACAVASAAVTVAAMRHHLAADRAELAAVEAEQDDTDAHLAARERAVVAEEDRLALWDAYFRDLHARTDHPDGDSADGGPAPIRDRFGYQPDAAAQVAAREPAEVLRDGQDVLAAERADLTAYGQAIAPSAEYVGEHFTGAIDAELAEILERSRFGLFDGRELTAALIAVRAGMPTGQYRIVGTYPDGSDTFGGDPTIPAYVPPAPPKRELAAAAIRSMAGPKPGEGHDTGTTRPRPVNAEAGAR